METDGQQALYQVTAIDINLLSIGIINIIIMIRISKNLN